jgi:hypothetical protein
MSKADEQDVQGWGDAIRSWNRKHGQVGRLSEVQILSILDLSLDSTRLFQFDVNTGSLDLCVRNAR